MGTPYRVQGAGRGYGGCLSLGLGTFSVGVGGGENKLPVRLGSLLIKAAIFLTAWGVVEMGVSGGLG